MNSEISSCSTISMSSDEGRSIPESLVKLSPDEKGWGMKQQSKGSKAYLSMGMGDSPWNSKVTKRGSIGDKRKVRRGIRQEDNGEGADDMLEAVKEMPSPPATLPHAAKEGGLNRGFQFPAVTEGADESTLHNSVPALPTTDIPTPIASPATSPSKTVRWSSATPSPSIRRVRHESQIQHPSPQNPPSWGWGKGEVEAAEEPKEQENLSNASPVKEEDYGNWNGNFGRPDSLGLYDAQGFLKSSPEKEEMLNI
jgi:hypothetical protein